MATFEDFTTRINHWRGLECACYKKIAAIMEDIHLLMKLIGALRRKKIHLIYTAEVTIICWKETGAKPGKACDQPQTDDRPLHVRRKNQPS